MKTTQKPQNIIYLTNVSEHKALAIDYQTIRHMERCEKYDFTLIETSNQQRYFVLEDMVDVCLAAGDSKTARVLLEHEVKHG